MAVREQDSANGTRRVWFVAVSLFVLFVAALFLRAYWNLDVANPEEGKFVLSGGPDPYYHKRAIDAIQENGYTTTLHDPMLNYPVGGINPNPPLFQWSIALAGMAMAPMFDGGLAEATWQATIWAPAILGALTIFPIYFIGAALFDRRVGLIAALFWTISTASLGATGVGDADHDAMVVFFAVLAFLFYIKAITTFRGDGNWVTRWSDVGSWGSGLGRFVKERRAGLAYALLAGISIAAVALTWKGYAYVIGIIVGYAGLQMFIDHWRNKDSTGVFFGTLIAIVVGIALSYPWYDWAGLTGPNWEPSLFIVIAFLVWGVLLVPTRDLPTILVIPAAFLLAVALGLVAFFLLPDIWYSLFDALVYFKRTKIYETIGEAARADFSRIVFGVDGAPFFLALIGWVVLLFTSGRHSTRPILFALVWAAIALFMAVNAVRFLFNAVPVFVVFGAFMLVWTIDWLDFKAIRKSLAANRGNFWQGLKKGVRPLHIIAVLLIATLLVVPATILAADAAIPFEAENRIAANTSNEFVKDLIEKRFGAYGGGFLPQYWNEGLTWLDTVDDYKPGSKDPATRPAFLAWWDYGHYSIQVGRHPAVADNFQNGYEFAANFILAQNETQAVQLLASRLAESDDRQKYKATLEKELTDIGAADPSGTAQKLMSQINEKGERSWQFAPELDLAQSVRLVVELEQATGHRIRYFAADAQMFPYDNPQTERIEQGGIFYAPVKLKGDDPDTYVSTKVELNGQFVPLERFQDTIRRNPTRAIESNGERLEYTDKFFNSMYWRTYVGAPIESDDGRPVLGDRVLNGICSAAPAIGMQHFRLVYASEALRIIEFYPGAIVEGRVAEDGKGMPGVTVGVFDDAGSLIYPVVSSQCRVQSDDPADYNVYHAQTTTDADGNYRIVAPFSTTGNTTIRAVREGVELGRVGFPITRTQANERASIDAPDINVERGTVQGVAFEDKDGNGIRNTTLVDGVEAEPVVVNATLTIGDVVVTTNATGGYTATGVHAGTQNVTLDATDRQVGPATARVRVLPAQTVTHDVAIEAKSSIVSGRLAIDIDGNDEAGEEEYAPFVRIDFAPDTTVQNNRATLAQTSSGAGGNWTISLRPGAYVVTATHLNAVDGSTYTIERKITVGAGTPQTENLLLKKR